MSEEKKPIAVEEPPEEEEEFEPPVGWSRALREILGREVNEEEVILALGELDDTAGIKLSGSPLEMGEPLSCGLHYHADLGDCDANSRSELRAMFLSTALQCLGLMAEMDRITRARGEGEPSEAAIKGSFVEHDLFGVDPLFEPTGPSGRSVITDADARPNFVALKHASQVATSLQGLMHPDIDFDVLGGISLNYHWPVGREPEKAERWAWVACMNAGSITCICHVRGEEPRSSFTIASDHLMSIGTSRLATFLTTGKSE